MLLNTWIVPADHLLWLCERRRMKFSAKRSRKSSQQTVRTFPVCQGTRTHGHETDSRMYDDRFLILINQLSSYVLVSGRGALKPKGVY